MKRQTKNFTLPPATIARLATMALEDKRNSSQQVEYCIESQWALRVAVNEMGLTRKAKGAK